MKGFGDKEEVPEGRRATRSSTRGASAPVSTPPPVKKEKKSTPSATDSAPRSSKLGVIFPSFVRMFYVLKSNYAQFQLNEEGRRNPPMRTLKMIRPAKKNKTLK